MDKAIEKKDSESYRCKECGVEYEEKKWADRCEDWCKEHEGSCNIDIIQHAIDDGKKGK